MSRLFLARSWDAQWCRPGDVCPIFERDCTCDASAELRQPRLRMAGRCLLMGDLVSFSRACSGGTAVGHG